MQKKVPSSKKLMKGMELANGHATLSNRINQNQNTMDFSQLTTEELKAELQAREKALAYDLIQKLNAQP